MSDLGARLTDDSGWRDPDDDDANETQRELNRELRRPGPTADALGDAHQAGKHSQKSHGKGGGSGKVGGHTKTGVSLSEMGRRGEKLFVENQADSGVQAKFGKVRETKKTAQGQNPIDIESDTHAIEVKTIDSRSQRLMVNMKANEVDSKTAAAIEQGKRGAVVAQIYDAGSGTMHVFAFDGGFRPSGRTEGRGSFELTGTRTGRPVPMERIGSYQVPAGTFASALAGLAAAALGDRDAAGKAAEPGDVVIEWKQSGGRWRATLTEMPDEDDEDDEDGRSASVAPAGVSSPPNSAAALTQEAVMPWGIREGGSECPFEVYNVETDEGADGGCHPSRPQALRHQRALQAREEADAMVETAAAYAGGKPNPGTPPDKRMRRNRAGKGKMRADDDGDGLGDAAIDDEIDAVFDESSVDPQPGEHFHAIMHTEGVSTGMRTFTNLDWRDPPFSFHWQKETSAHGGQPAVVSVGLVSRVVRDPETESIIHGFGPIDLSSDNGAEYARRLAEGFERWVSIGLDESPFTTTVDWPDTDEDDDEANPLAALFGTPEQIHIDGGRIGELTGVSVPAQDDAVIEATDELRAVLAGVPPGDVDEASTQVAGTDAETTEIEVPADGTLSPEIVGDGTGTALPAVASDRRESDNGVALAAGDVADVVEALTASAHVIRIPDPPPSWWFDPPTDVEIPGALCVTDEGRLYGIVAPLGVGHRAGVRNGGRNRITAPSGNVDYSRFMKGEAIAVGPDGDTIRVAGVGPVTMDCGHASRFRPNHSVAPEHYDNACSVVAKIRVGEMGNVVWAAGALEPGVTPSQVSRMLACVLSGDWQPHPDRPGWSELVAALLVPSEGFAVGRSGPTVTSRSDGVLVASAVPVLHREPHYIPSIDRDPVLALGLNDVAASAVRKSYVRQIVPAPVEETA